MAGVLPVGVWAVLAGVLGLAVGSFLNVVIYRVPAGESIVSPPSKCPSCGAEIHNRHNVPVVGWLVLRGRCFACQAPISARYPVIEAVTAALFVVVTLRIVDLDRSPALPAYLYLSAAGLALAVIDLDTKRLPDKIVLPSYGVVAVLLTIASVATGDWWALARAALGAAALYVFYFATAYAYPAGMGFGDVKLAGVLGGLLAYLSWSALFVGAFAGFALGSVVGTAAMAVGRAGRKTQLPFGPFMIAGALLAIFVAAPIASAYLRLVHRA